jgi:hypothetical protein
VRIVIAAIAQEKQFLPFFERCCSEPTGWPRRLTIKRLAEVSTYAKFLEWSLREGA